MIIFSLSLTQQHSNLSVYLLIVQKNDRKRFQVTSKKIIGYLNKYLVVVRDTLAIIYRSRLKSPMENKRWRFDIALGTTGSCYIIR